MTVLVKSRANARTVAGTLSAVVKRLDPQLPVGTVASLERIVSSHYARQRLTLVMMATFALLTLVLAAVGIHGVIAYAVALRRREIGIRLALGATGSSVVLALRRASRPPGRPGPAHRRPCGADVPLDRCHRVGWQRPKRLGDLSRRCRRGGHHRSHGSPGFPPGEHRGWTQWTCSGASSGRVRAAFGPVRPAQVPSEAREAKGSCVLRSVRDVVRSLARSRRRITGRQGAMVSSRSR